jgi:alginate O-acetyltransferase complex protein AlgI
MVFSSSLFLLYFLPLFLVVYFVLTPGLKNWWLLLTSVFFYAWGAPVFVFVVAGSVVLDWFILQSMARAEGSSRRWLFWLSVVLNLALLLYYKYTNFFVDQVQVMLGWFGMKPLEWVKIALPVGISFITFQKLACTLDVYKKRFEGFTRFTDYALYIFMFPQLLAGPIVRPGQIAGQIRDRRAQDTLDGKLIGFYRFVIGLAKKVLIADVLAVTANEIFALEHGSLSTGMAWIGAIAYTFQIYFDFSGYSDMAIGLARMAGFRLPENFNSPYVSQSITEFWRRWHITLSFWFRDYVFLPLAYATSRKLPAERYLGMRADKVIYLAATSVTFLLCGFWHGAAWTFILWGVYQGLFLILDRMFLLKYLKKAGRIPATLITFLVITIGWVIFRADTVEAGFNYIGRMFEFTNRNSEIWLNPKFWTILALAAFFSVWGGFRSIEKWLDRIYDLSTNRWIITLSVAALILFILSVASIASSGFNPFIYFRF